MLPWKELGFFNANSLFSRHGVLLLEDLMTEEGPPVLQR